MEQLNKLRRRSIRYLTMLGDQKDLNQQKEDKGNEISSINNLPNEILMKILGYLDKTELFKCRLVNTAWNQVSSRLLHDKDKERDWSNLTICLKYDALEFKEYRCSAGLYRQTKAVDKFIQLFSTINPATPNPCTTIAIIKTSKKSESSSHHSSSNLVRPFPFCRFHFEDLKHFEESKMIQFLSIFGQYIKTLELNIKENDKIESVQKFWNLLRQYAPNIKTLSIEGGRWLSEVKLFDHSDTDTDTKDTNHHHQDFIKNIKRLKVCAMYKDYLSFIEDILSQATNVQEILPLYFSDIWGVQDLKSWSDINKLHLIKQLKLKQRPQEDYQNIIAELEKVLTNSLRLQFIHFDYDPGSLDRTSTAQDYFINFIHTVLKSSRESLKSLRITSKKRANPEFILNSISLTDLTLPNVHRIRIEDNRLNERSMSQIGQLCPNTVHLDIQRFLFNFPDIAPAIWTHFRQLKSFSVKINLPSRKNYCSDVDSAFTGYSHKAIQRIKSRILKEEIELEEARKGESQDVSLFDLKELSQLDVRFDRGMGWDEHSSYWEETVPNELKSLLVLDLLPQHLKESPLSFQIDEPSGQFVPLSSFTQQMEASS